MHVRKQKPNESLAENRPQRDCLAWLNVERRQDRSFPPIQEKDITLLQVSNHRDSKKCEKFKTLDRPSGQIPYRFRYFAPSPAR